MLITVRVFYRILVSATFKLSKHWQKAHLRGETFLMCMWSQISAQTRTEPTPALRVWQGPSVPVSDVPFQGEATRQPKEPYTHATCFSCVVDLCTWRTPCRLISSEITQTKSNLCRS